MARNYAALFHDYGREMGCLSDAEFGRLCRALIEYSANGTPIALGGNERFFADRVMMQEDKVQASYAGTSQARSEAGKAGANKRWQNIANDCKDANQNKKQKQKQISPNGDSVTRTRFVPPTFEDVSAYCEERGGIVDPVRWYDYYSANGWKVGKNSMKDWKAAVRTWERDNRPAKPQGPKSFADMWREMQHDES